MKIAITNISFLKKNIYQIINFALKNSIKHLELCPSLISKDMNDISYFKKIGSLIKKNKIKIVSLNSVFFLYKKNFLNNDFEIQNFKFFFYNIIKISTSLKCNNISIGALPYRKIKTNNKKKNFEVNLKIFKIINKLAKKNKINLLIEPISQAEGCFFLNNPMQVLNFISKYKLKNCKLLLDLGNLLHEKIDYRKFIKKNISKINHIHVRGKNMNHLNLNNTNKIIRFLNKNYKKTYTLEYLSPNGGYLKDINFKSF